MKLNRLDTLSIWSLQSSYPGSNLASIGSTYVGFVTKGSEVVSDFPHYAQNPLDVGVPQT